MRFPFLLGHLASTEKVIQENQSVQVLMPVGSSKSCNDYFRFETAAFFNYSLHVITFLCLQGPPGHRRHYSHDSIWPIAMDKKVLEGKSKHIYAAKATFTDQIMRVDTAFYILRLSQYLCLSFQLHGLVQESLFYLISEFLNIFIMH